MGFPTGKRLWLGAVLGLCGGAFLAWGIVQASVPKIQSTLTDYTTTSTTGTGAVLASVASDSGKCLPSRTVSLVRENDKHVMKSDSTDKTGKAVLKFPKGLVLDNYYLALKKRKIGTRHHRRLCTKNRIPSNSFHFDPAR
jgi:hypothetical protein